MSVEMTGPPDPKKESPPEARASAREQGSVQQFQATDITYSKLTEIN